MIFKRVFGFLGSSIGITLLVAIGVSLLIWTLGPFFGFAGAHPWASPLARLITIGVIVLLALSTILLIVVRRSKRAEQIEEEIIESVDDDTDHDDELVRAELGELKGKLREALSVLRKSKLGRKSLYELPWYVMIGPPGAGKTTAIINSGLQFPLAETTGKQPIGGVGGTRNCDWWFTNNAVLIDTAGRYTTQESDLNEDNAGWVGFLRLLKKHRKRQPINGAVVAISLSDLSLQDEETQQSHAIAVRRRLHELREKLGVRFPVYVLFTKSDLIAGFSEFFDNLSKEDREQVWGFTFPVPKKTKTGFSPVAAFDDEFGTLLSQLNAQSLERMQQETDHQRRSLIASFPSQVASVRTIARAFLEEAFQDNRFEKRHLLRGVYFTSGTQEGTPIDRLMMGMARTFGIGRQAIGSGQGSGRSFFLTRLFDGVMFPEAGLVSADDKVERQYRWSKRIAIAAAVLGGIALSAMWARSYIGNTALLAEASDSVEAYRVAAEQIPGNPIADSDLPGVVPALNILRDMPANQAVSQEGPERALTYGLYQGKVVGNQAAITYRDALNQHLLPRLLLRLEDQMQANMNNADFLYESLKIYLMLGKQGPMNQTLVQEWMDLDWSVAFQGQSRATLREDLKSHLNALLAHPTDEIGLNGPLVEQIQSLLAEMPLAQRVYNGIINSPSAQALGEWRLSETAIGGPAINRAMVRSSGRAFSDGIEGIFTYNGFNTVFLDEAIAVPQRIQSESWVLGKRGEEVQNERALANVTRAVLDLYYTDFISRYDQLLDDLNIIPFESLNHAVEVTNVLSSATSPISYVLTAVSNETKLTEERAQVSAGGLAEGAANVVGLEAQSRLSSRQSIILGILGQAASDSQGAETPQPGTFVVERFAWLHEMVAEPEGQPSQLAELVSRLSRVRDELSKLSFAGGVDPSAADSATIINFQEMANRMDGPIPRWASQITQASSGITAGGTRAAINAKWQEQVLPFCTEALANRYPFDRGAKADVGLQDFARLFSPGGLIDTFVDENLGDLVDTRSRPWTWKKVNGADLGINQAVLQQMQYASEIRDAFFANGATPAVRFQVTPEALDPKADKVTLDIDGQEIVYAHSPAPKPAAVTWPGSVGSARIVLQPIEDNSSNAITREGPWAWLRLLSAAELRRTNVSDRSRAIFNVGGRIAIFQLQSGSVLNPFSLVALSKFSCPSSF